MFCRYHDFLRRKRILYPKGILLALRSSGW